ncbi:hypothetical protein Trydic_g76 [Trypoxylus dichotomus]
MFQTLRTRGILSIDKTPSRCTVPANHPERIAKSSKASERCLSCGGVAFSAGESDPAHLAVDARRRLATSWTGSANLSYGGVRC